MRQHKRGLIPTINRLREVAVLAALLAVGSAAVALAEAEEVASAAVALEPAAQRVQAQA